MYSKKSQFSERVYVTLNQVTRVVETTFSNAYVISSYEMNRASTELVSVALIGRPVYLTD